MATPTITTFQASVYNILANFSVPEDLSRSLSSTLASYYPI
jgi:hypothetical protein